MDNNTCKEKNRFAKRRIDVLHKEFITRRTNPDKGGDDYWIQPYSWLDMMDIMIAAGMPFGMAHAYVRILAFAGRRLSNVISLRSFAKKLQKPYQSVTRQVANLAKIGIMERGPNRIYLFTAFDRTIELLKAAYGREHIPMPKPRRKSERDHWYDTANGASDPG